jgi:hypothetical protein
MRLDSCCFVLISLLLVGCNNNHHHCQAFVSAVRRCCRSPSQPLVAFPRILPIRDASANEEDDSNNNNNNNNESNDNDNTMDVERERNRLESLMGSSSGSNATIATTYDKRMKQQADFLSLPLVDWKKEVCNPPLLTSIGRERMEAEITLLESLAESDDAIPELWNLWYGARGPGAKEQLMITEALVAKGQPDSWKEAEDLLRKMIANEGIHWVEPVNRLATLMFLQSRHEESKELCELVLQLKPWHFGALSGMVMVQQGLQNQEKMLEYARQRMPPLPKKGEEPKEPPPELAGKLETRQEWVDRMLDRARAMLLRQEMDLDEAFLDLDRQNKQGILKESRSMLDFNTNKTATSETEKSRQNKGDETPGPATAEDNGEEDAWQ